MDALRIENLRSLTDTEFVELKPLTLLVGQNSSGKSTFLRCFPLLRQSGEARKSGPILWNGRFVDFGSFSESLNSKKGGEGIRIHIRSTIPENYYKLRSNLTRLKYRDGSLTIEIMLQVSGDDNNEDSYLEKISLNFLNEKNSQIKDQVTIEFDKNGKLTSFITNQHDFTELTSYLEMNFRSNKLIPTLENSDEIFMRTRDQSERNKQKTLLSQILVIISDKAHPNTNRQTILGMIEPIVIENPSKMLETLKKSNRLISFKKKIANWTTETPKYLELRNMIISRNVPELLQLVSLFIDQTLENSRYIAPLRATAERYYRTNNLAVNEVDFRGDNLAMFLKSLEQSRLDGLKIWLKKHFGFYPVISVSGGHVSIRLKEKDSAQEFNIADKGFGFSQILPIIVQLYFLGSQRSNSSLLPHLRNNTYVFSIEQPELHLHPYLQAQLVDAFIAAIKAAAERNITLKLLIETHSETIINRLGHQVRNKKIKPSEINIVLFEKIEPDLPTTVKQTGYDENGFLKEWPFGFFEPRDV